MIFITGPLYSGKRTFAQNFPGTRITDVQELAAAAEDLDGVEVFNGHPRHDSRNPLALEFAAAHPHLIRTSGSDYHRTQDLATGGIETDRDIRTPADLVKCLKDNAFTRIGG